MRARTSAAIGIGSLIVTVGLISLDSGDSTGTSTKSSTAKADKYEQTWRTPYGSTTCGEFLNMMDDHQRWVTAADMLVSARKVDGVTALPADTEVARFQGDMATACEPIATVKTTEIGASIYLMDSSYRR
jgi:hypothetical protein